MSENAGSKAALVDIIDLSKFGSGTDMWPAAGEGGAGAGDGDGKVSFVLMSSSRLMTGLNVVIALSVPSIRLLGAENGVVSSGDLLKDVSG